MGCITLLEKTALYDLETPILIEPRGLIAFQDYCHLIASSVAQAVRVSLLLASMRHPMEMKALKGSVNPSVFTFQPTPGIWLFFDQEPSLSDLPVARWVLGARVNLSCLIDENRKSRRGDVLATCSRNLSCSSELMSRGEQCWNLALLLGRCCVFLEAGVCFPRPLCKWHLIMTPGVLLPAQSLWAEA